MSELKTPQTPSFDSSSSTENFTYFVKNKRKVQVTNKTDGIVYYSVDSPVSSIDSEISPEEIIEVTVREKINFLSEYEGTIKIKALEVIK